MKDPMNTGISTTMNDYDKKNFMQFMHDVCDAYHLNRLTHGGLKIQFEVLKPFSIHEIQKAIYFYMQQHPKAEFMPKPGDIVKVLTGNDPSVDEIIACARLAKTPLGILCLIHIGTFDLKNGSITLLRSLANECLQNLPDWKNRAFAGNYSDHEISIMLKHHVDSTHSFHDGLESPQNKEALIEKIDNIGSSKRHQFLLEKKFYLDAK